MAARRPDRDPDFEASVTFLATNDGGKTVPARDGYFTIHDFQQPDGSLNDALHVYPDAGEVAPGHTARAQVWLLAPQMQRGRLHAGFEFRVQEGNRVVGHGMVVRVLNPDLLRDAAGGG